MALWAFLLSRRDLEVFLFGTPITYSPEGARFVGARSQSKGAARARPHKISDLWRW